MQAPPVAAVSLRGIPLRRSRSAETVIVFDRCIVLGGPGGPVCSEIKAALYRQEKKPKMLVSSAAWAAGISRPEEFEDMISAGRVKSWIRKLTGIRN